MGPKTRIRWVFGGIVVLGILLYLLRTVLSPVFLSLVLAYILDPVIDRFEKRRIPRSAAIGIFVVAVMVFFAALILLIAPMIQREMVALTQNLPDYTQRFKDNVLPWLIQRSGGHFPTSISDAMGNMSKYATQLPPEVIRPFAGFIGKVLGNTAYLLLSLLSVILVPVFTFYFLRDFDDLKAKAAGLIPLPYREWTITRFRKVDEVLGSFIRGQLTVCTILAVLYSFGLWLVGVDLAVVIGVTAGYLFIVPYLGTIVGVVAASIMALLQYHDFLHLVLVWLVFGLVQLSEGYFFTPKIVGSRVGLNPVSVIIALLVAGGLFGFLGILIAVPVAAVLKIFAAEVIDIYRASPVYTGEDKKPLDEVEKPE